jgi:hypothetical protein
MPKYPVCFSSKRRWIAGLALVAAWWCGGPNHDQTPQLHLEIHATSGRVAPNVVIVNTQVNGSS